MQRPPLPIIDQMKMNRPEDESGIILSWFLRVGLFLALIGVVGFDVGSIIVNNFSLSSSAEDVAIAVSIAVDERGTTNLSDFTIFTMAKEVVADEANGVARAKVLPKGTHIDDAGVVHVRLRRRADTLFTHLIAPLKERTVAIVDGQAGT